MSMDIGGSANASVSADGNASAGASIGGGIGSTLAGALGGSLSAGIGIAGGLALSAAANFAANLNFSAGLSASVGASTVTPGTHPPDIYPLFKFIVQIAGLGPVRFQSCGPIKASPVPAAPASAAQSAPATQSAPGAHNAPSAGNSTPATHAATAASTQHVAQGGAGGASVMLPSGSWKWDDLTLKRGLAKDGTALLTWIMQWVKGNYQTTRSVTVIMLDLEGKPAMTWTFKDTFPKEWSIPSFEAGPPPGALVIETLKLGHQGAELILS